MNASAFLQKYWNIKIAGWLIVAAGILLRLQLYIFNRSFWADEGSLAFNIATKSLAQLTQPLDYQQGAPIGFLFIEKFALLIFGDNEYALRLFPLIAGCASVYLTYQIVRDHFDANGLFALTAVSSGSILIYYSSELKQYSSDAAIGLLMIFLALTAIKDQGRSRDFLALGLGGMIAIWVSHPSVFMLAGIGLALFIQKIKRKEFIPWHWIILLGTAWITSFVIEYYVSLRLLAANDYLQNYWGKAFMPMPPWRNVDWFVSTYFSLLLMSISTLTETFYLSLALAGIGAISLAARKFNLFIITISPFVLALIASALEKYPLKDRFMLFLVPLLLILIAEGIARLYAIIKQWNHPLAVIFSLTMIAVLWRYPITVTVANAAQADWNVGIRPAIQYVAEQRVSDELIYVYHGADSMFHYYAPRYGLNPDDAFIGYDAPTKKESFARFEDDVRGLRGQGKVWFIISHVVDCGGCGGDMHKFYFDYLSTRGTLLDQYDGINADAYLFEMKKQQP
jgi:hypothetical protein